MDVRGIKGTKAVLLMSVYENLTSKQAQKLETQMGQQGTIRTQSEHKGLKGQWELKVLKMD